MMMTLWLRTERTLKSPLVPPLPVRCEAHNATVSNLHEELDELVVVLCQLLDAISKCTPELRV